MHTYWIAAKSKTRKTTALIALQPAFKCSILKNDSNGIVRALFSIRHQKVNRVEVNNRDFGYL